MAKSATKITAMLDRVLERIRPDEIEINRKVSKFAGLVEAELKKQGVKAKIIIGGSIGKGTSIKGDHDIDLFIAFDYSYDTNELSNILEKVLNGIKFENEFKETAVHRLHGSRDYFRVINELNFELVPVLDIKNTEEAKNITDCSPMHVVWVKSFFKKNPRIGDEIRLVKAFCKSAGVYGAESYLKGFSGHVVDILTIYHDGFLNLLKASQKWKEKEVIDFYKTHKGKALFELNQSKLQSPIIVIDPIQKERNAAAALEKEQLEKFRAYAKKFLQKPGEEFFAKKTLSMEEMKSRAGKNKLVAIEAYPLEGKEDVVGAKLLKAFEHIKKSIVENDFKLLDADWLWNRQEKACYFFVIGKKALSPKKVIQGPPIKMETFALDFRKKHKKVSVKSGKLYAEEKREYLNPEKLIETLIKEEYVKEKIKKAKILLH